MARVRVSACLAVSFPWVFTSGWCRAWSGFLTWGSGLSGLRGSTYPGHRDSSPIGYNQYMSYHATYDNMLNQAGGSQDEPGPRRLRDRQGFEGEAARQAPEHCRADQAVTIS
jgi:hypothetical protein